MALFTGAGMSSWFTKFHCIGLLVLLGSSPVPSPTMAYNQTSNRTPSGVVAVSSDTFLSSLGVNTHVDQGYRAASYVAPLRYLGIRNIRDGGRNTAGLIMLHQQTGARVDLVARSDVSSLIAAARTLARVDALLAIEGPNEPNNWPITYNGQKGGGKSSWIPVAQFQRDLYAAVKGDPVLKNYPVFHVSEGGAETDNVGLQFLSIPKGAGTLFPDGTQYADYANVHNYVSGTAGGYEDNQAWKAADPTLNSHWDGLYVEYGRTWRMGFRGHSDPELQDLQRVTTETGWDSVGPGKERLQGVVLVNTYLAQFKRGWRYTFVYQLRDDEGGDSDQGLYRKNSTPKLSATYIHYLTSILADKAPASQPGRLNYSIANKPATVHDLLLQKSSGIFELVIWGEQVSGSNNLTVNLGGIYATVKIYDTTSGTSPIQILTNVGSVPLTVSDHAVIIEIQ
jgi:hypothetical protein